MGWQIVVCGCIMLPETVHQTVSEDKRDYMLPAGETSRAIPKCSLPRKKLQAKYKKRKSTKWLEKNA